MWPKDRVWNSRDIPPCPKERGEQERLPKAARPLMVGRCGLWLFQHAETYLDHDLDRDRRYNIITKYL
jgi:hypothetical protein